jgi:hypothetical protein
MPFHKHFSYKEFCYWLQGVVSASASGEPPTQAQWDMIKLELMMTNGPPTHVSCHTIGTFVNPEGDMFTASYPVRSG